MEKYNTCMLILHWASYHSTHDQYHGITVGCQVWNLRRIGAMQTQNVTQCLFKNHHNDDLNNI